MFGKFLTRKREIHHLDWVITDFISQLNAKLKFRYQIHQLDIEVEGKRKQIWNDTVILTITCHGQFQITKLMMRAGGGAFADDLFAIADQVNLQPGVFTENRRIGRIKVKEHSFGTPEYEFEIDQ